MNRKTFLIGATGITVIAGLMLYHLKPFPDWWKPVGLFWVGALLLLWVIERRKQQLSK